MTENQLQIKILDYFNKNVLHYPEAQLMYHIQNEGLRFGKTGAIAKKKGVKKGVPDLCLPLPTKDFGALYIELKAEGKKPNNDQLTIGRCLVEAGNDWYCFDDFNNCVAYIKYHIQQHREFLSDRVNSF